MKRTHFLPVALFLVLQTMPWCAFAFPSYLASLPGNRQNAGCLTCHVTSGGVPCGPGGAIVGHCLNPFGALFLADGHNYSAIAGSDPDADNISSDAELGNPGGTGSAPTLPGFPNPATNDGCDMATCAANGSQTCGSSGLVCTSSHDTNAIYSCAGSREDRGSPCHGFIIDQKSSEPKGFGDE
jgi:hypothetical protein